MAQEVASLYDWLSMLFEGPLGLGIRGAPLALSLGEMTSQIEVQVLTWGGVLALAVVGACGYGVKRCQWLPSFARQAILTLLAFASLLAPFAVLHWFGPLTSKVSNFTLAFLAVLGTFRMIELMQGTGPEGFDTSLKNFVVYFACPAEVLFEDGKFKRAAPGNLLHLIKRMLGMITLQVVFLSVGRATNFVPFLGGPDALPLKLPWLGFPYALPSSELQACYVYTMLSTAMLFHRMLAGLFGVDTLEAMNAPLISSTTVREFWGRRWNIIIHRLMKRTFFTPLHNKYGEAGRHFGGVVAFMMSALLHEYMWLLVAWYDDGLYVFGLPVLFFLAQYALGAVETAMAKTPVGRTMARLPQPVLVVCTTLAILPLAPLFLHGIHAGGMMSDSAGVFPTVVPAGQAERLYLLPLGGLLAALGVGAVAVAAVFRYLSRRSAPSGAKAAGAAKVVPVTDGSKKDR